MSLGLGDNPRIGLQGYMAVTSNSIQFGAAAEIYAAAGDLNIYGWLKFDALVVFSPFYFEFAFSVGFALRWEEDALAGISISGLISGPSPFHIRGEACVSILFVDICIGFDVTIGEQDGRPASRQEPMGAPRGRHRGCAQLERGARAGTCGLPSRFREHSRSRARSSCIRWAR